MNIRTLIVDDEDSSRRTLRHLLGEYAPSLHIVAEAANTRDARRAVLEHAPDVMFLDIEMPEENGLDFLHTLHASHRPFATIVVTGFEKYAIPAFREQVFAYLLKPIDVDELRETALRLATYQPRFHLPHAASERIPVRLLADKSIHFIDTTTLMYSRAEGNYCQFFLSSGRNLLIDKSLAYYERFLIGRGCIRIHKSYIVNPRYIQHYRADNNEVF